MWFGGAQRNLGIVTGWKGLVVIDFDQLGFYGDWLRLAMDMGGIMAATAMHTYRVTSARGVHLYIKVEEPVEAFQCGAIDIKAGGGYVLAPPSIHPSGMEYKVLVDAPIMAVEKLADVFPFSPTPLEIAKGPGRPDFNYADAWEAASLAARIELGDISRIRAYYRIEDLLGIQVQTTGRRLMVCCPVHRDTNPSMEVNIERQHVTCFGCGFRGDVIDLYARLHGMDNRGAIREMVERMGKEG
jgi:hypothetical protein